MRNRGSAVLEENNCIALIKRNREGMIYYVFPGGGIENGETPEEATIREVFAELGVVVKIIDLVGTYEYNGTQYFYLGEIVKGEYGTGMGEEFTDQGRNRGTYEPVWVPVDECSDLDIRPKEVINIVQNQLFSN